MHNKNPRIKITKSIKDDLVVLKRKLGSADAVGKALGVSGNTINKWIRPDTEMMDGQYEKRIQTLYAMHWNPSDDEEPEPVPEEEYLPDVFEIVDGNISTVEIAQLTDKLHKHILRDTKKMFSELNLDESRFGLIYTDKNNREKPCYNLPEDLVLTLISGYSIKLRHTIITRLKEVEQVLAGKKALPPLAAPAAPSLNMITNTITIDFDKFVGYIRNDQAAPAPQQAAPAPAPAPAPQQAAPAPEKPEGRSLTSMGKEAGIHNVSPISERLIKDKVVAKDANGDYYLTHGYHGHGERIFNKKSSRWYISWNAVLGQPLITQYIYDHLNPGFAFA